ncbi:hypothetical protein [Comamonas aquatica]|uniref:hypothetical protein n=1 Tax=Comamonas aquatica TaxID=225991 RepID=UPI00244A91B9|nr:hypothetical protein [Comamonas aquatica]MDH0201207.1 hypothetical protein [Comamonas aquatica]MDH1446273.1 hypothetical protein [Comamonas aquatica]MDH1812953.1 hypothetical protein [Comamonas aquatica]
MDATSFRHAEMPHDGASRESERIVAFTYPFAARQDACHRVVIRIHHSGMAAAGRIKKQSALRARSQRERSI